MSSSSPRRGQVSPVTALAATAVVVAAVSLYAVVLAGATPAESDRDRAAPALDATLESLRNGSVVEPDRLGRVDGAVPGGYRWRVELRADGQSWTRGPPSPARADAATAVVAVRLGPGRVRPGRLRVAVWR